MPEMGALTRTGDVQGMHTFARWWPLHTLHISRGPCSLRWACLGRRRWKPQHCCRTLPAPGMLPGAMCATVRVGKSGEEHWALFGCSVVALPLAVCISTQAAVLHAGLGGLWRC